MAHGLFAAAVARELVLLHACCAIALIGAATHGAQIAIAQARGRGQVRERLVRTYATVTASLFSATLVLGVLAYPTYRIAVRVAWLDAHAVWAARLFEIKEDLATIGTPLAIGAWLVQATADRAHRAARLGYAAMAVGCAAIVWFDVIAGLLITMARAVP